MLVFQALTIIPSLIYIEEGIYISEQGRDSFFVGATFFYLLYFVFTFFFISLTFNSLRSYDISAIKIKLGKTNIDSKVVLLVALLSLFILLVNAAQSKLPIFDDSVTRFTYWKNSQYPFLNKIFGNVSVFIPFCLGIVFKKHRKTAIFLMVVYFAYNFTIGQKFSPIVSGLYAFILPNALTYAPEKVNLRKFINIKTIIAVILIFGSSYYVIYKRYENNPPYRYIGISNPNEAIVYRAFGLQGHLFWGTVETYMVNSGEHTYDLSDLEYGMHELMYQFMPNREVLDEAKQKGASYTNGYPSILLMIYPAWLALLVHIFFSITILGLLGWLLYKFIIKEAYIVSVITFQFFNWAMYAFTMGYFYKLKIPILFILIYLFLAFILFRIKKKENIIPTN
jgi:hypothetical protein